MANLNNKLNEYSRLLKHFDKFPKSVLAAIAVSHSMQINGEDFDKIETNMVKEWEVLYNGGIVPQKPIKL